MQIWSCLFQTFDPSLQTSFDSIQKCHSSIQTLDPSNQTFYPSIHICTSSIQICSFHSDIRLFNSNIQFEHSIRKLGFNIRFKHSIQTFNPNIQFEHSIRTFNPNIQFEHSIRTFNSNIQIQTHRSQLGSADKHAGRSAVQSRCGKIIKNISRNTGTRNTASGRMARHLRILMSLGGGPFKRKRSMKAPQ